MPTACCDARESCHWPFAPCLPHSLPPLSRAQAFGCRAAAFTHWAERTWRHHFSGRAAEESMGVCRGEECGDGARGRRRPCPLAGRRRCVRPVNCLGVEFEREVRTMLGPAAVHCWCTGRSLKCAIKRVTKYRAGRRAGGGSREPGATGRDGRGRRAAHVRLDGTPRAAGARARSQRVWALLCAPVAARIPASAAWACTYKYGAPLRSPWRDDHILLGRMYPDAAAHVPAQKRRCHTDALPAWAGPTWSPAARAAHRARARGRRTRRARSAAAPAAADRATGATP